MNSEIFIFPFIYNSFLKSSPNYDSPAYYLTTSTTSRENFKHFSAILLALKGLHTSVTKFLKPQKAETSNFPTLIPILHDPCKIQRHTPPHLNASCVNRQIYNDARQPTHLTNTFPKSIQKKNKFFLQNKDNPLPITV